jgi:hypothetical protein
MLSNQLGRALFLVLLPPLIFYHQVIPLYRRCPGSLVLIIVIICWTL